MASTPPSRTTRASLLRQLQMIWDEIGESDTDRDNMLLQLEQECLDIYHKKVEETRKHKADLFKWLADAESEVTNIASSLGDSVIFSRGKGTLKQQLANIRPALEELRSKKDERLKEFLKIKSQISLICVEIAGCGQSKGVMDQDVDQCDLTMKKLGELKSHLNELQNEKMLRQQKVKSHTISISELSEVMSIDFSKKLNDIHPSLNDSSNGASLSISNDTLASLTGAIQSLKQEKQQRLQKIQELAKFLVELWDLMEMPIDERKAFSHVTRLTSASVDEVSIRGCLSANVIKQVEVEVQRLNVLKASKMKELVFKRQNELEVIYRGVDMDVDSEYARQTLTSLIESGNIDMSKLLQNMDDQIIMAKEQALSRRDILDRAEKWKFAVEEEMWLDEYEKDENRYSAVRGADKNLKRAEKARILVGEIQSMVWNLTAKVKAWEVDKGISFLYEKVPLLDSLNDYNVHRKQKSREQKRINEQLAPLCIKVLLVGLKYPSYESDILLSSIPSLALFREHLIGWFRYQPKEIKFLADVIADVPTSSSDTVVEKLQDHLHILQILRTMAEGAKQGDKLVYYFSGHGLKLDEDYCMDLGRDQDGKLQQLYGDEVEFVMANLPDGVTFHPFYDCCHSAGIPSGIPQQYPIGITPPTFFKTEHHNQIAFTAVDDPEAIAYGSLIHDWGIWCSHLMYALISILIMLEGNVTYIDMADLMNSKLAEKEADRLKRQGKKEAARRRRKGLNNDFSQHPSLYCDESHCYSKFLC